MFLPAANAEEYQISDDGYAHVPLDFAFPYQGQTFIDSYMFSNGVVGFMSPTSSFCCNGYNITNQNQSNNFSLFVLQTDLIDSGPGQFTAIGDESSMTYTWTNVAEYGTNNLNTFSASIYATGRVDYQYSKVNLTNHTATIGYTGDTTLGQYYTEPTTPAGTRINVDRTVNLIAGVNPCDTDPLYSTSCVGYSEAYLQLQCSYDPLYDMQCQGYQDAYYSQQCYANPLYDEGCAGYSEAYLQQQCAANPLYDQRCTGYAAAHYAQQCAANPLYDSGCDGYEQAYYGQQCSIDPLYDRRCEGYDAAYQHLRCSIDPLYSTECDGYTEAYRNQQCDLNSLYDNTCPGYDEAHDAYVLERLCAANKQADSRCPGYTVTQLVETSVGAVIVVSFTDPVSGTIEGYTMGTTQPEEELIKEKEPEAEVPKVMKEEAKAAAKEMASAKTIEAQQKAQESVLAMLGYVPGFGAYSFTMDGGTYEDNQFYQPEALPESKSGVRNGLAQQVLHTKMIMMQYEEK